MMMSGSGPMFTIDLGSEVAIGKVRIFNWNRNDAVTIRIYSESLDGLGVGALVDEVYADGSTVSSTGPSPAH